MPTSAWPAASLAFLLVSSVAASAQSPKSPASSRATFTVSRATSPITLDGLLDEPAWREAVNVPVAYEWSPGDNIEPPVKTDCLITYDEKNLYVAFRAHDPRPDQIRAHFMDRDDTSTLIQDDHVGLLFDTFNDERRAFQFRVNPLGVQADAIFSEQDGLEDFSWDMIWTSVGRIDADGYVVEIALPLKQLRFQAAQNVQTWGFQAFRSWPRSVRHRLASHPVDRNTRSLLSQTNRLTGFAGLTQGRNFELDPTATFARTDARESAADPSLSNRVSNGEAGLSARWSLTPSVTANGTVNPDFSQVEADVAQLDVNRRFALYYPEKRPFFLEGIDLFTTPLQAVFTRTVADPLFGAKVTGRQGATSAGVFVTRDRLNNLLFPSNEGSSSTTIDTGVTTLVGRARRDVGNRATIGALVTSRAGGDYYNRVAGADAFWRATPSDSIRVQFIRSDTRYPEQTAAEFGQPAGAFEGNAFHVEYQHVARQWIALSSFESYDRGFRSDTGFVPRVNLRSAFAQVQRRWQRGVGSWFTMINVGMAGARNMDSSWSLADQSAAAFVNYAGPYQTLFQCSVTTDIVVVGGVRYEYPGANVVFSVKPNGKTNAQITGRFGGGVDFANQRSARSATQIGSLVEYRPVKRLSVALQYNLDRLSVAGGRLYRADLVQLKTVVHLNVRSFVRAILQYTNISHTPSLYGFPIEPRTRKLFSQYLFSYKLNPQTVLFLGYSDNASGSQVGGLPRQNRTFFVKIGYAWIP